jgi:hypothetical protein
MIRQRTQRMNHRSRSHPGHSSPPRYPGTFLLAFREALAGLNWQARRWLGNAVECVDAEGREQVVGLENLYRRARREDRAGWPRLIATFLQSAQAEHFEEPPPRLSEVADRLLVRVGPPPVPPGDGPEVWSQALDDTGLGVTLVVDYPQSMCYVTETMVADSGAAGTAWLERAVANLHARTPADCLQMLHPESGMRQCVVGDAYDSSRVLLLDALLPEHRADGCFAALPGRDELLVLPVTPMGLAHVPLLKALAEKNFKTAPYPISDEVYWIQGGVWRRFTIDIRGERVAVQPPMEFMEVLKRLMPDQAGGETEEAGGSGDETPSPE